VTVRPTGPATPSERRDERRRQSGIGAQCLSSVVAAVRKTRNLVFLGFVII
jgi:hypothetical protein